MALIKFEPLKEFEMLTERMRRFFDDFPTSFNFDIGTSFSPRVDISEDENNIYVHAEIPGAKKEDIKISVQDNVLTIKGEKKTETKDEKKNYYRVERCYGSFSRSFSLPTEVDVNKTTEKSEDGVLHITLTKVEPTPPAERLIEIQ
ncbi:MAG: Hsp20/alpha crystallin family protein [Ignavibacteria bacterium]|nr:Hsp20/alpha crystallin family protein [Ignavibacteria bacterium]